MSWGWHSRKVHGVSKVKSGFFWGVWISSANVMEICYIFRFPVQKWIYISSIMAQDERFGVIKNFYHLWSMNIHSIFHGNLACKCQEEAGGPHVIHRQSSIICRGTSCPFCNFVIHSKLSLTLFGPLVQQMSVMFDDVVTVVRRFCVLQPSPSYRYNSLPASGLGEGVALFHLLVWWHPDTAAVLADQY